MEPKPHVFVIDDDLIVLKAIERLLRANDYPVEVFVAFGVSRTTAA
jgi:FixJ family two-component response regulator